MLDLTDKSAQTKKHFIDAYYERVGPGITPILPDGRPPLKSIVKRKASI